MRRVTEVFLSALVVFLFTAPCGLAQVEPAFKSQIDMLNELTDRRRVNTFFPNEQSIFHGLQTGHVNVSAGNLTFVRRDLVTVGRIPVVFARVFDSSQPGTSDFSRGWRISLAETISQNEDGSLAYTDESYTSTTFISQGDEFSASPPQPGDLKSLRATADGFLVTLRNKWTKRFINLGALARLVEVTDNNGNTLNLIYDPENRLAEIRGQNNRSVTIDRNEQGKVSQISDDQGRSVVFSYNNHGELSTVSDLGGNIWSYKYANGMLHQIVDPKGNQAVLVTYEEEGRVKHTKFRHQKTSFAYLGNSTKATDDLGNVSVYRQNQAGVTTAVTNAEGLESGLVLNSKNEVVLLRHNGATRATFSYDSEGNPERMVRFDDDGTVEMTYVFDWTNRVVEMTGTDGFTQVLSYDSSGNLKSNTVNGQTTQFTYSPHGDLLSETDESGATVYSYDDDGLLTGLTKGDESSSFSYGPNGRLASITFPNGSEHSYAYTSLGFRSSTSRSNGSFKNYQYDSVGNLFEISGAGLQGGTYTERLILDKENQISRIEYQDGSGIDVQYDGKGNPVSLDWDTQSMACEYDSSGRLTAIEDSVYGLSTYEYQANEPDIRKQLDDRTAGSLADIRRYSQTLGQVVFLHYVRSRGTPWPVVMWDPDLSVLDVPTDVGLVEQTAIKDSADQRRRLYNALATDERIQPLFDKASNSFFLPPEYVAMNCEYGNTGTPWFSSYPSTAFVGQTFSVTASVGWSTPNCGPIMFEFYVNGTLVGGGPSGLSKSIDYEHASAGTIIFRVRVYCTFADSIPKEFSVTIIIVDCSTNAVNNAGKSYVNSRQVRRPYEEGAELRCTGNGIEVKNQTTSGTAGQTERCAMGIFIDPENAKAIAHTHPFFESGDGSILCHCNGDPGTANCPIYHLSGIQGQTLADNLNQENRNFSTADMGSSDSTNLPNIMRRSDNSAVVRYEPDSGNAAGTVL